MGLVLLMNCQKTLIKDNKIKFKKLTKFIPSYSSIKYKN